MLQETTSNSACQGRTVSHAAGDCRAARGQRQRSQMHLPANMAARAAANCSQDRLSGCREQASKCRRKSGLRHCRLRRFWHSSCQPARRERRCKQRRSQRRQPCTTQRQRTCRRRHSPQRPHCRAVRRLGRRHDGAPEAAVASRNACPHAGCATSPGGRGGHQSRRLQGGAR